jgi:muconolactone delta-isomerase
MRYLVVTKSKQPFPPEMAAGLLDAMSHWTEQYTAQGKIEQSWGFAGIQGGGGILNVDSPEELDDIMTQFPFAPFSDVEIYGLVDLHDALNRNRRFIAMMAAAMPAR